MAPSPRRLLVVEDEPLTSALLRDVLQGHGFEVATATSASEARRCLDDFDPDAALLDIMLGDGPSGVALGNLIVREYPAVAVLFLTRYPDAASAGLGRDEIPAGCAFLLKDRITEGAYLLDALEATLQDRSTEYRRDLAVDHPLRQLTPNQQAVLRMMAQGLTNAAIAKRRGTSESAVEQVVAGIFRNLHLEPGTEVNPRMQAARLYISTVGLPEDP